MVQRCIHCAEHRKSQQKEPLHPHKIPGRPWQRLAADLFEIDGQQFLLVADYYSKMPFVKSLTKITSSACIDYLKSLFVVHGIPDELITDNGRQFVSEEFQAFTKAWNIAHQTSSPYYPQSNGFIERMAQTIKTALKKCKSSKSDPQLALLSLRSTPIDTYLPSPAEILFGRHIQGTLPSKIKGTNPKSVDIKQRLTDRQITRKHYYDTHTKELPVLQPNSKVTVLDTTTGKWSPATVMKHSGEPRTYVVQTDSGQILCRNRLHLRETQIPKKMAAPSECSRGEEDRPTSRQPSNSASDIPDSSEPHITSSYEGNSSGLGLPSTTKDDDPPDDNNDNASQTSRYGRTPFHVTRLHSLSEVDADA
ncbi:endogenous retrovirus group K member 11 Pol protein [Elysia marginata]|uniref:Endogenous retrovirus group K member 11 Pol protein n=1 Tax=Elysia marginata TaxID=1093978 RepID=A0AAV4K0T5_9GAST|nr:endogenous retrovirus group K member 11 Pol protein [Elysia marginata]